MARLLSIVICILMLGTEVSADDQNRSLPSHLTVGSTFTITDFSPVYLLGHNPGDLEELRASRHQQEATAFHSRPLISRDQSMEYKCVWCKELPGRLTDLEGDKPQEVVIQLADNIFWADGTPIVAQDFVLAFAWTNAIVLDGQAAWDFHPLTSVKGSKDNRSLVLEFTGSDAQLLLVLSQFYPLPSSLEKPPADDGKTYAETTAYRDPFTPGLYNGPFVPTAADAREIEFIRNKYFSVESNIKSVRWRHYKNPASLAERFQDGTVDLLVGSSLPFTEANALASANVDETKAIPNKENIWRSTPGPLLDQMTFNMRNPALNDVKVRQALALAIPDMASIAGFSHHMYLPVASVYHPRDPSLPQVLGLQKRADPDTARKLLDQAGWITGEDGKRYRDEEPLEVDIVLSKDDPLRAKVTELIAKAWADIGVVVLLKEQDNRVFMHETVRRGLYKWSAVFSWETPPGDNLAGLLHSEAVPTANNEYTGLNSGGFMNRTADQIFSSEVSANQMLLGHSILGDQVPVVPLIRRKHFLGYRAGLNGVYVSPDNTPSTNYAEHWYWAF